MGRVGSSAAVVVLYAEAMIASCDKKKQTSTAAIVLEKMSNEALELRNEGTRFVVMATLYM